MCAWLIKMVFALAMSNPASIIVVATKTSYSPPTNLSITSSNASPSSCPCAIPILALGTKVFINPPNCIKSCTRLCMKNICPPRSISNSTASLISFSLKTCNSVRTGCRLGGGVLIILKSRAPINEKWSVLGMGVAVRVNVSTLALNCFNFSFTPTPNFCSSSIMSRPKSLNFTSLLTMRWVPIIISILPSASFPRVSLICFADLNRLI